MSSCTYSKTSFNTTQVKSRLIITIDGPVAAGKTTAAHGLSALLQFTLLDTGAIYRCVALGARQESLDWDDESALSGFAARIDIDFKTVQGIQRVLLHGVDVTKAIRQPEISHGASTVSAFPGVRAALLDLQSRQAVSDDVIAEGRDTGTVVFPHAEIKFFLTADAEIRAERRHSELRAKGYEGDRDRVLIDLQERDKRDSGRAIAPLIAAADAVTIDSTHLDAATVVSQMQVRVARFLGTQGP